MALRNELKAVVTADIRQFTSAMSTVGLSATSAATVSIAAFSAITATIIGLEKAAIGAAKSYETLRIRLQLLNGDMKQGAMEFERIKDFAEGSAFETDKLIDAYIRLRAVAGQDFASKHIENIAFASKVAGQNIETMAARLGDFVLRVRTGLTPGLLRKALRGFGTTLGKDAVEDIIAMSNAGRTNEQILVRLEQAMGRMGEAAKKLFSESAEGMEKQLGGLVFGGLAGLGGPALKEYKVILRDLINFITELKKSDSFDGLGEALAMLMKQLSDIVKDDSFKDFIENLTQSLTILMKTINAVASVLKVFSDLYNGDGDIEGPFNPANPMAYVRFLDDAISDDKSGFVNAGLSKLSEFTGIGSTDHDPIKLTDRDRKAYKTQVDQLKEQRRINENTQPLRPDYTL